MYKALINSIEQKVKLDPVDKELVMQAFLPCTFKRSETVLQEGNVSNLVYFVNKGLLYQYYVSEKGQQHICSFAFNHEFIADLESFSKKIPSHTNIAALSKSECLSISCDALVHAMQHSKPISHFFQMVIEEVAFKSMERTKMLLTSTPEERFSYILHTQPHILQLIPQKYIAQYLGMAPESLSRIKNRMAVLEQKKS